MATAYGEVLIDLHLTDDEDKDYTTTRRIFLELNRYDSAMARLDELMADVTLEYSFNNGTFYSPGRGYEDLGGDNYYLVRYSHLHEFKGKSLCVRASSFVKATTHAHAVTPEGYSISEITHKPEIVGYFPLNCTEKITDAMLLRE